MLSLACFLVLISLVSQIWNKVKSLVLRKYPKAAWVAAFRGAQEPKRAVLEMIACTHFREPVDRDTTFHGVSVTTLEQHGLAVIQDDKLVLTPLMLIAVEDAFQLDLLPARLASTFLQLDENNFPGFILDLHRITYTLLKARNLTEASLHLIYRNASDLVTSNPALLDTMVPIPADVPKVAKEVQAGVTNAESAVLLERGLITTNDYGIISVATNLVETRIRAHGFDAITPHGNEQSKFGYRNSNGKFARLLVAHSALEMYLCFCLCRDFRLATASRASLDRPCLQRQAQSCRVQQRTPNTPKLD
jgi:hypothetical protein